MTSPGCSKLHKFKEMTLTPPNPKDEEISSCSVDKRILNDK